VRKNIAYSVNTGNGWFCVIYGMCYMWVGLFLKVEENKNKFNQFGINIS